MLYLCILHASATGEQSLGGNDARSAVDESCCGLASNPTWNVSTAKLLGASYISQKMAYRAEWSARTNEVDCDSLL